MFASKKKIWVLHRQQRCSEANNGAKSASLKMRPRRGTNAERPKTSFFLESHGYVALESLQQKPIAGRWRSQSLSCEGTIQRANWGWEGGMHQLHTATARSTGEDLVTSWWQYGSLSIPNADNIYTHTHKNENMKSLCIYSSRASFGII